MSVERLEEEKSALMHRLKLMENGVRQTVLRDSEFRKLRFQLQNAMNRLTWKKKKGTAHYEAPVKKEEPKRKDAPPTAEGEEINSLGEPEIDLERLVSEYRKGRR